MEYHFEGRRLDTETGTVYRPDGQARLRPQLLRLLIFLIEASPRVVTYQELLDEVWQVEHISSTAIQRAVSELRSLLGDSDKPHLCIVTVPKQGYRFCSTIVAAPGSEDSASALALADETEARRQESASLRRQWRLVALTLPLLVLLVFLILATSRQPASEPLSQIDGSSSALKVPLVDRPLSEAVEELDSYSQALDLLQRSEPKSVLNLLTKVTEAVPTSALVHWTTARAQADLGEPTEAQESLNRAKELGSSLSREQRLLLTALGDELDEEWQRAVESYQSLLNFFPDDHEVALRLARSRRLAHEPTKALEILERLRALPAPDGRDPRVEIERARIAWQMENAEAALEAALMAAELAADFGSPLSEGHARILEGQAQRALGDRDMAMERFVQAGESFALAGHQVGIAQAVLEQASMLYDVGRYPECRAKARRVRERAQRAGDFKIEARAIHLIAKSRLEEGDSERARQHLEEGIEVYRNAGSEWGVAFLQVEQGHVLMHQGRLREAAEIESKALETFRQMKMEVSDVTISGNLGMIYTEMGRLDRAEELLAAAARKAEPLDRPGVLARIQANQGVLALEMGRWQPAELQLTKALETFEQLDWAPSRRFCRLHLGILFLRQGRLDHALEHFQILATGGELGKHPEAGLQGLAWQAWLLLARGEIALAEQKLEVVRKGVAAHPEPVSSTTLAMVQAHFLELSNRRDEAQEAWQRAISDLQTERPLKAGWAMLEKARLLLIGEEFQAAELLSLQAENQFVELGLPSGVAASRVVRAQAKFLSQDMETAKRLLDDTRVTALPFPWDLRRDLLVATILSREEPQQAARLVELLEKRLGAAGHARFRFELRPYFLRLEPDSSTGQ